MTGAGQKAVLSIPEMQKISSSIKKNETDIDTKLFNEFLELDNQDQDCEEIAQLSVQRFNTIEKLLRIKMKETTVCIKCLNKEEKEVTSHMYRIAPFKEERPTVKNDIQN